MPVGHDVDRGDAQVGPIFAQDGDDSSRRPPSTRPASPRPAAAPADARARRHPPGSPAAQSSSMTSGHCGRRSRLGVDEVTQQVFELVQAIEEGDVDRRNQEDGARIVVAGRTRRCSSDRGGGRFRSMGFRSNTNCGSTPIAGFSMIAQRRAVVDADLQIVSGRPCRWSWRVRSRGRPGRSAACGRSLPALGAAALVSSCFMLPPITSRSCASSLEYPSFLIVLPTLA